MNELLLILALKLSHIPIFWIVTLPTGKKLGTGRYMILLFGHSLKVLSIFKSEAI